MDDGPPVFSADSSCPQILWIPLALLRFHLSDSHTLRSAFPCGSVNLEIRSAVLTPVVLLHPVWPLPLSLATTRGISFDFSSSGYLDVSVPRVTSSQPMCSAGGGGIWVPPGSPIRRSTGHGPCAPHRGLSQLVTSFVGFLCQGIHRVPLPSSLLDGSVHTYTRGRQRPLAIRCDLLEKENIVFKSRYAALKVRRGRPPGTGHCAPGGAATRLSCQLGLAGTARRTR